MIEDVRLDVCDRKNLYRGLIKNFYLFLNLIHHYLYVLWPSLVQKRFKSLFSMLLTHLTQKRLGVDLYYFLYVVEIVRFQQALLTGNHASQTITMRCGKVAILSVGRFFEEHRPNVLLHPGSGYLFLFSLAGVPSHDAMEGCPHTDCCLPGQWAFLRVLNLLYRQVNDYCNRASCS